MQLADVDFAQIHLAEGHLVWGRRSGLLLLQPASYAGSFCLSSLLSRLLTSQFHRVAVAAVNASPENVMRGGRSAEWFLWAAEAASGSIPLFTTRPPRGTIDHASAHVIAARPLLVNGEYVFKVASLRESGDTFAGAKDHSRAP